jgi:hypothetical protein
LIQQRLVLGAVLSLLLGAWIGVVADRLLSRTPR